MDPNFALRLIPYAFIFIAVVFVFIIGVMIYIKRWNDKQPIQTVEATLVFKEVERDKTDFGTHAATPRSVSRHVSIIHHYYYITFRTAEEPRRRFIVTKKEFQRLNEGDRGTLTFQGGRYLGFKKAETSD